MSQMISLQPLPHAPPGWNKYDEHLLRNKIFPRNKYGWFLLTNPSQRERNCSAQLVGGRSTLSLQSEGASSQVIDAGNGQLWWLRWSWQWLKMFFSSSVQSADPNHPLLIWKRVPGRRLRRHSEQANGSKGGDASQDLRSLRLQELEEGACHHGWPNSTPSPYTRLSLSATSTAWFFFPSTAQLKGRSKGFELYSEEILVCSSKQVLTNSMGMIIDTDDYDAADDEVDNDDELQWCWRWWWKQWWWGDCWLMMTTKGLFSQPSF